MRANKFAQTQDEHLPRVTNGMKKRAAFQEAERRARMCPAKTPRKPTDSNRHSPPATGLTRHAAVRLERVPCTHMLQDDAYAGGNAPSAPS